LYAAGACHTWLAEEAKQVITEEDEEGEKKD